MILYTETTFIGIDPTAGQRPFVYAALNSDLRLLALGHGEMNDVLAFAAGQRQAVVAVCAPRQPNLGIMEQTEVRQQFSPPPRPGRWTNFRAAEYALRQHNIAAPRTPASADQAPNWMQVGFTLFHRLEGLGYQEFPTSDANHQTLEVYPHACYTVLLGQAPFPKYTLEGRIQRQLCLYERKLGVPDPMRFFEEITRHRLLNGILPLDELLTPGELDALVAAYTACVASTDPEKVTSLGHPKEGQVYLPIERLKSRY
jgi:hypothetical protein